MSTWRDREVWMKERRGREGEREMASVCYYVGNLAAVNQITGKVHLNYSDHKQEWGGREGEMNQKHNMAHWNHQRHSIHLHLPILQREITHIKAFQTCQFVNASKGNHPHQSIPNMSIRQRFKGKSPTSKHNFIATDDMVQLTKHYCLVTVLQSSREH